VSRPNTGRDGDRSAAVPEKVTRDDIEAKLRELRGEVDERVGSARATATVVAVAVAVGAVVIAYWMGRRRTRKRQMVLEIRRI
jgi:hypothetical protein